MLPSYIHMNLLDSASMPRLSEYTKVETDSSTTEDNYPDSFELPPRKCRRLHATWPSFCILLLTALFSSGMTTLAIHRLHRRVYHADDPLPLHSTNVLTLDPPLS
jgi:hypothetical protein